MAAMLAGMCSFGYAQTTPDYLNPPKQGGKVIDNIVSTFSLICREAKQEEIYMQLVTDAQARYPNYVVDIRSVTYTRVVERDAGTGDGCRYREYR